MDDNKPDKKPRGRPKGSGGNKRPDIKARYELKVNPGENSKYLSHNLTLFKWDKPDMTDENQVVQRVIDYFQLCADNDMKPSVAGLALAFSVSRHSILNWVTGGNGSKQLSDYSIATLKKAYDFLNAQMEDYMQNGKINPVAGIFLMKNNMGYRDQQEVAIRADQPLGEQLSDSELQKKYIEDALGNGPTIIDAEPSD